MQASPVICVNTSICIGHIISGNDYTCSSCSVGYALDSQGKCNLCSVGYEKVSDNPYTCVLSIDYCMSISIVMIPGSVGHVRKDTFSSKSLPRI